ncbi:hypothetical protein THAOC_17408 [Thalassiosira oceanica]|uniref:Uncharacterized protein n=1 Tax=Thalassiosira oceanica TaxID=159749 RepID=K0SUP3_THAOC|nr:hypothetical protein THAOC_17408 [Thalassiosira oceanica]|eukprot:EJK62007.1 hypothetical protein THAOC_17408 [Thalassiosira oceanica]
MLVTRRLANLQKCRSSGGARGRRPADRIAAAPIEGNPALTWAWRSRYIHKAGANWLRNRPAGSEYCGASRVQPLAECFEKDVLYLTNRLVMCIKQEFSNKSKQESEDQGLTSWEPSGATWHQSPRPRQPSLDWGDFSEIYLTQGHIHGHWNLRRQLILPSSQTCPFGEIEAAIKATRTKTSPEVQEVSLCGSYLVNND